MKKILLIILILLLFSFSVQADILVLRPVDNDENFVNIGISGNAFGGTFYGTWAGDPISPGLNSDTNFQTAGFVSVTGDSNFSNLGISGNTFLQSLFASNFVTLHANPTSALHASTKDYVDLAVAGSDFDLFLYEIASTDVATYQQLQQTASEGVEDSDVATVSTDAFLIQAFVTEQSDLNISTLSEGVYSLHIHASATTAGVQDAKIFWRMYARSPTGAEVQINGDSEESAILTTVQTQYDIHLATSSETNVDGNRFVIKVYANLEGVGGNPNVTIFYEGTTASRAEFKTVDASQTSHDLLKNREWVDANHSFIQTGQTMDIGSYNFNTIGDGNFANIGFSEFIYGNGSKLTGLSSDINGTDINPANVFIDYNLTVQQNINALDLNVTTIGVSGNSFLTSLFSNTIYATGDFNITQSGTDNGISIEPDLNRIWIGEGFVDHNGTGLTLRG